MTTLKRTLTEYRIELRISRRKHLLVEGRDDKRLFTLLLDEFFGREHGVDVDSVEDYIEKELPNNRDQVEDLCHSIGNMPFADKLVGFSDREFRGFETDGTLTDTINCHRVEGRLVWSRGHSIENYFFAFPILYEPMRDSTEIDYLYQALDLFENVLESAIRVACAIGITGHELQKLDPLRGSIDKKWLAIESSHVTVNIDDWKEHLIRQIHLTGEQAEYVLERFLFWYQKTQVSDVHTIRWMCDGHIGLKFLWIVYARCVAVISRQIGRESPEKAAQNALKSPETNRFNTCASWWIRRAKEKQSEYPEDVFQLLGLLA